MRRGRLALLPLAVLTATGAGIVLVPLNHRHAGPELRYALADSGARVLFADRDIAPIFGHLSDLAGGGDPRAALVVDRDGRDAARAGMRSLRECVDSGATRAIN